MVVVLVESEKKIFIQNGQEKGVVLINEDKVKYTRDKRKRELGEFKLTVLNIWTQK